MDLVWLLVRRVRNLKINSRGYLSNLTISQWGLFWFSNCFQRNFKQMHQFSLKRIANFLSLVQSPHCTGQPVSCSSQRSNRILRLARLCQQTATETRTFLLLSAQQQCLACISHRVALIANRPTTEEYLGHCLSLLISYSLTFPLSISISHQPP